MNTSTEKNRDPQEKFQTLAVARVNRALRELRLIGNLANRKAYQWDEAQSRKIIKALEQGLDQVRQRFAQTAGRDNGEFKL